MIQRKTRVLRLINGIPEGPLGTVIDCDNNMACVTWDDGVYSVVHEERLVPHQRLKSWFKYGPKLKKRTSL